MLKLIEEILNPTQWDRELSDAWHKDLPDVIKSFENLRLIAIKRLNEVHIPDVVGTESVKKTQSGVEEIIENKIDVEKILKMYEERRKINKPKLSEIIFMYNGREIKVPKEEIEEWVFTGLDNFHFITNRQWDWE